MIKVYCRAWWQAAPLAKRLIVSYNLFVWCATTLAAVARLLGYLWFSTAVTSVVGFVALAFGLWVLQGFKEHKQQVEQALLHSQLESDLFNVYCHLKALTDAIDHEYPFAKLFDLDHAPTADSAMPHTRARLTSISASCKQARQRLQALRCFPLSRK